MGMPMVASPTVSVPSPSSPPSSAGAAAASSAPSPPPSGASSPTTFTTTSLYVGDLDVNVSEAQLYEIFAQIGPVVSVRVLRDMVTRRSLGYAYVNYGSGADAGRAIELLNYMEINNRPIRIMFSQRDPTVRRSGNANIFIKNLDREIDHKALNDTFAQFGTILSCKVAMDPSGNSKGYGFVQFEKEEGAKQAIEAVNGMLLNGKQVYVGPFVKRTERDSTTTTFTNVYVKNLGEEVTEEELRSTFAAYGVVTSAALATDEEGKSKGFGFINFEDPLAANKAVEELDGKNGDGEDNKNAWVVCRAQKKAEREAELKNKFEQERKERIEKFQGANLYLKNLDEKVDDAKLREIFKEVGTITSCKVLQSTNGMSRGSGFVAFSTPEEATRAVTEMNGKMINGKPLYVALAQRKEERRARLQQQYQSRMMMMGPGGQLPPMMGTPGVVPGVGGVQHQLYFAGQPGMVPMMPGTMHPMRPQQFMPMMQGRGGGGHGGQRGGRRGQGGILPPHQQGGGQRVHYQQGGRGGGGRSVPLSPSSSLPGTTPPTILSSSSSTASALSTQLAHASPDERRMILGETLYPMIEKVEKENAAKITGMLLEMDQAEILHLIESPEDLNLKMKEALTVLAQAAGGEEEEEGEEKRMEKLALE